MVGEPLPEWMLLYPTLMVIMIVTLWRYVSKWPVAIGLIFFLIHIAVALHIIPLSRFAVIADRYVYISTIGSSFIIAYYFVMFIMKKTGMIKNIITGIFICILLYLGVFSNLRSREWKDTESIKKELLELIKQRKDYVPKEFEKLIEKDNTN